MTEWLGHRDLCATQWGESCDCPCSDKTCPGIHVCADPDCSIAAYLAEQDT